MSSGNQWEAFYDRHAPYYDRGAFTKHTVAEVDFLLDVLALEPGARVLDLGCGTGRHAIELASRGFRVTGVDLSSQMLAQGMVKAEFAKVELEWVHANAAEYVATEPFDAVLCLCGAALTTADLASDPIEHDTAILRNVRASLSVGAPFVLTTPNGYRRIREVTDADVTSGRFDPVTMVQTREDDFTIGGAGGRMLYRERLYTLPELLGLLRTHGFETIHAWGGSAGRWAKRPLEMDEIEMMVVSQRV